MTADSESDSVWPVGPALRDAKRAVRERTLAMRDALPGEVRAAKASAIAARIIALPSFAAARTVLLTLSFRSEWDTLPLVRTALAGGKTVVLPRVNQDTRMLVLHAISDPDREIEPGYRQIPEPRLQCPVIAPDTVDWVLVPGVAFDTAGRRLGYGGGYYDRLLPLLAPRATRVAAIFDVQLVSRVPAAPHDLAVDTIVTETRTISVA
jgi:5-formyltetrahydrofolate cyclo-ligase